MKIDLEFVELHSPLFITHGISGTNFGEKLHIDPKKNLKGALDFLYYDTDLKHTIVGYKGKVSLIENVASMTLIDPMQVGIKTVLPIVTRTATIPVQLKEPIKAQASGPGLGIKFNAQVETPIDKVQGKPGRKAKYQGEESQGE